MPHALEKYRDEIDALIGPIEELIAKIRDMPPAVVLSSVGNFTLGGLEQAKDTLEDAVISIDEFEEEEVEEEVEPDEEQESEEESEEDENEDEDA